ncbi:MAG: alpha/beta hydrolase fold protein [Dehalococcoidia bacterium]|nr:alpha/beta hydrolase fold protein [Dehalococcoidia bacterium]
MPLIRAGDINIYCEIHGRGKPLVLLMGLGCHSGLWLYQVQEFSKSFQVIVIDNRGISRSDKPSGDYSIAMMADDTANLLKALNIPKAHILGMSMGGAIAQRFALRYPQMVDKLVLACTFSEQTPYGIMMMELWEQIARGAGIGAVTSLLLLQSFTPRGFVEQKKVVAQIQEIFALYPQPVAAYVSQNHACQGHNTSGELPLIKVPTLGLVGERDIQTPVASVKFIAEKIPGAKLQIIPRCGHGFMWEAAEQFNEAVMNFLRNEQ